MNTAGALSILVAAVTGGDSCIGAACALALAEAGANVTLLVHAEGETPLPRWKAGSSRTVAARPGPWSTGAITVRDGHWTMGDEHARGEALMIGYAEGDGLTGPWSETKHSLGARRPVRRLHLSPGPMLLGDPNRPIMLYNGAMHDGTWGISWVVFDHPNNRALDRCEEPLDRQGRPGAGLPLLQ